jgi:uncharacterized Fe-S center protein
VFLSIRPGGCRPGDTHYIRPIFATHLIDLIKKGGGNPTIIETSGMGWLANRTSEARHLESARRNGFSRETMGADIKLIDGAQGLDSIKDSIVARGLEAFDSLIVLSHVTGHIQAGFGGAIKNIGLGCVTKSGKYRVHYVDKPSIDREKCTKCDECLRICPVDGAIEDYGVTDSCTLCSLCLDVCEPCAITSAFRNPIELTSMISENASQVIEHVGAAGFINLAIDVLPHCDCHPFSDLPIVPDIGVLASLDPVAIDRASVDMVQGAHGVIGTSSHDSSAIEAGSDKFTAVNPCTSWKAQLNRAEELGLGGQIYEIKTVK